jgi:hypothetical protein
MVALALQIALLKQRLHSKVFEIQSWIRLSRPSELATSERCDSY